MKIYVVQRLDEDGDFSIYAVKDECDARDSVDRLNLESDRVTKHNRKVMNVWQNDSKDLLDLLQSKKISMGEYVNKVNELKNIFVAQMIKNTLDPDASQIHVDRYEYIELELY